MKIRLTPTSCLIVAMLTTVGSLSPVSWHVQADEPPQVTKEALTTADEATGGVPESKRVTVEVARDRARLLHDVYEATLDTMHHRYFHGDRAVIPARAMEDVFEELQQKTHTQARWISVNLKAMSLDHEPETKFEKAAAAQLGAGKPEVEVVEEGVYRRATPIPLGTGCISCHGGLFRKPSEGPKFAGLVISIPVRSE